MCGCGGLKDLSLVIPGRLGAQVVDLARVFPRAEVAPLIW
jgi:hypothetical protein